MSLCGEAAVIVAVVDCRLSGRTHRDRLEVVHLTEIGRIWPFEARRSGTGKSLLLGPERMREPYEEMNRR